ncbi:MAG: SurA N-terminal domain-containing protein [Pseudomonadales bacterium]
MLQGIRDNSQGIVAKIIVGFIAITFALFGVESLVSLSSGSGAPATVNGEEISEAELYQATQLQRRQILAQMGESADPASLDDAVISGLVLNSLIEQKALLTTASANKMLVSDAMVDRVIAATPQFQADGAFSVAQFDAAIRNLGFTRQSYRDTVKKDLLIQQQRAGYALSSYALPSQVKQVLSLDRQTRDVRYFALPIDKVKSLVSVSDDEVQTLFEARKNTLNTQEQVTVEYLMLKQSDIAATLTVSDEDIQAQYDQLVASFESQEQRTAAHILIEVSDELDDTAALEKINTLKARIDAGEDFAALAAEFSDDIGSAANGGDLGVQERGTFEQAFEDALYALDEGAVSEAVQSESGYHLIKVTEVRATAPPLLEDVKDQLVSEVTQRNAEKRYLEVLEQLTDISFSSADLQEPAEELNLAIRTTQPFANTGGDSELTQNSKVLREAFSTDVLNEQLNSKVIELDDGNAVVLHLKEHFPVRALAIDEVAEQLRQELLESKAASELEKRAAQAIAEIKATGDASVVAADFELVEQQGVTRADTQLPPAVVQKAFRLAHPSEGKSSVASTVLANKNVAIVIVDKVVQPDLSSLSEQELKAVGNLLANQSGQRIYQAFVDQVNDSAEIERL